MLVDELREVEIVDRAFPFGLGAVDQGISCRLVQSEVPVKRFLDALALDRAELVVGVSDLEQQGAGGNLHPITGGPYLIRRSGILLGGTGEVARQEVPNRITHGCKCKIA